MKPNHHWVTHVFDQLLDFGPVYGIWTFATERLNKVLKGIRTNNHSGGDVECSFMRSYFRYAALRRQVRFISSYWVTYVAQSIDQLHQVADNSGTIRDAARLMLKTNGDDRGTVGALASAAYAFADEVDANSIGDG